MPTRPSLPEGDGLHESSPGKAMFDASVRLLSLMFEGKLVLRQEEFFGEIMVQACRAGGGLPESAPGPVPGTRINSLLLTISGNSGVSCGFTGGDLDQFLYQ